MFGTAKRLSVVLFWALISFASTGKAGALCAFNDWMVSTFHASEEFAMNLKRGTPAPNATRFSRLLGKYSTAELKLRIRAEGHRRHEPVITGFFLSQRIAMASYQRVDAEAAHQAILRDLHRRKVAAMRGFIGNLRCEADPSWRPAPGKSFTDGATGLKGRGGTKSDGLGHSVDADTLGLVVLAGALSAAAIGGVLFKFRKRLRRRARRYTCALPCTITTWGATASGEIVDISQLGAKIQIEGTPPNGIKRCVIDAPGLSRRARVIWSNAHFIGVTFKPGLSRERIVRLLRPDSLKPGRRKNGATKDAVSQKAV